MFGPQKYCRHLGRFAPPQLICKVADIRDSCVHGCRLQPPQPPSKPPSAVAVFRAAGVSATRREEARRSQSGCRRSPSIASDESETNQRMFDSRYILSDDDAGSPTWVRGPAIHAEYYTARRI